MGDGEVTPESQSLAVETTTDLVVVGIGASAGGLEALQTLVENLDSSANMAYIVAQHVSADYRSMMVDLLRSHTSLVVQQAEHGQQLLAGEVFVCPPGFHITVMDGDVVALTPVEELIYLTKPSIDLLFRSLADVKGPRSIGIILSGTGSDGSSGVGAIKDVDGFSIAQQPSSAKYDGMPLSAINSGKVDLILPPMEIGQELRSISPIADRPIPEFRSGRSREAYERILLLLRRDHGVNFGLYKDKTLSRRIMRRMIATKTDTIEDYAHSLTSDPVEVSELFHDVLIGVTHFFRDTEAFAELREQLEAYIADKTEPIIRIWSVGCSTGEEPYSLAILLAEILGDDLDDYRVQIFATDVNERSIEQARRGRFSTLEVSGLSDDVRDRYFALKDGYYEVSKRIKQKIVFSQHDMMQDPPFLRQDLVVCRNVIIYFGPELQETLLPVFHYALLPGAMLFLGKAETVGSHPTLWDTVSSSAKIYRASGTSHRTVPRIISTPQNPWQYQGREQQSRATPKRQIGEDLASIVNEQLEKMLSPNVIVIDAEDQILYSHSDANPLLQRRSGIVTNHIFANVHSDAVVDLRTALHRLRAGEDMVATDFRNIRIGRENSWVRFVLGNTATESLGNLVVVYCQIEETLGTAVLSSGALPGGADMVVMEQEKQVSKLREQLAIVMEQLDQSNEEMQALNEELQSSNEELQSSNEELETTNEELQSTNEELHTAYAELRIAFDEKEVHEGSLKQTAAELEEVIELLAAAESLGRMGSWRWRPQDEELTWSDGLHDLLGTTGEEVAPSFDAITEKIHVDDRPTFDSYIQGLVQGDEPEELTFRVEIDGTTKWLTMLSVVTHGQYQNVQQVVGKIRDVTRDRLAAQQNLDQRDVIAEAKQENLDQLGMIADAEQRIEIVLNESSNAIYVFDLASGKHEFTNDCYVNVLGWTNGEINEMDPQQYMQLFHADHQDRVREHLAAVAELGIAEGRSMQYRFRHRNGEWVELDGRDTVLETDGAGRATKLLGTFSVIGDGDV